MMNLWAWASIGKKLLFSRVDLVVYRWDHLPVKHAAGSGLHFDLPE
ncbi:hypothetical protein [Pannonibacter phragmitetus]|nr:hypothetical protein [Pannonibacter phragmitetus]